jgi:hypothetical protein
MGPDRALGAMHDAGLLYPLIGALKLAVRNKLLTQSRRPGAGRRSARAAIYGHETFGA